MASARISELASIISRNTAKVNDYLSSRNLPAPAFDVDAPSTSLIPPEAEEVEAARAAVIDATTKLHDLMLGPRDFLQSFTHDELISMQAISRFKIASSFPFHEEASFAQISKACGLNEPDLRRILRHAMTKHIFREPRKGVVVHTAASRLLAEDTQILDWVGASTDELWQAASQTVNAMVKYPGSQEPNQTGFALANNTEKSMYEVLSQYPDRAKRFGNAMSSFTTGTGYDLKHLVDNYPWASIGNGTVVDVGGSHGFVCIRLASSFPSIHFIVQDLPEVVDAGSSKMPAAMSDRVTFMAHDFLTEQPVKGADIYFFRWIFHNWSDKYCTQILRSLIPALKPGARVVIMDNVLPEPNTLPLWPEERIRSMDLTMLELQNSREREIDDWAELFRQADARYKFLGGKQPKGSRLWIIEAIWQDEKERKEKDGPDTP
ncbi:MAG: hypothetical protein M1830_000374 [Pleopsidium flavum]|nr:MAG: hypothetical protein M1830_000374 [Pleopsidium flavum]